MLPLSPVRNIELIYRKTNGCDVQTNISALLYNDLSVQQPSEFLPAQSMDEGFREFESI